MQSDAVKKCNTLKPLISIVQSLLIPLRYSSNVIDSEQQLQCYQFQFVHLTAKKLLNKLCEIEQLLFDNQPSELQMNMLPIFYAIKKLVEEQYVKMHSTYSEVLLAQKCLMQTQYCNILEKIISKEVKLNKLANNEELNNRIISKLLSYIRKMKPHDISPTIIKKIIKDYMTQLDQSNFDNSLMSNTLKKQLRSADCASLEEKMSTFQDIINQIFNNKVQQL